MELWDLMSADNWMILEKEINRRSGLNAAAFDKQGSRVTSFVEWANELCARIKGDPKGQRFICGVANQSLIAEAKNTKKVAIGECDAGLTKFLVPVFVADEFLGVVGGCGTLTREEGQVDVSYVDAFLINKVTNIGEQEIAKLATTINRVNELEVISTVNYVKGVVRCIVRLSGLYQEGNISVLNVASLRQG